VRSRESFTVRSAGFVAALLLPLCLHAEPNWPRLEASALDLLQRYIRIESVNPPANTTAAANLIKGILEGAGIPVRLYPSGPNGQVNLLARLPGKDHTKKPLLLLNHFDVVPVDRKAWQFDPFAATIRDGILWGRGALDMKSIGIQHVMSLVALRENGVVPPRDIVMLSTADEETNGTLGVRWMIQNHLAEFDPEYVLDEGGFGTRDILAAGKLVFGVPVGEKQTVWLRVRAKGTAAHGSQPIPDNANLTLLAALQKAIALPPATPHPVVAEMVRNIGSPLAENKYTAAIQKNTASLTTLTAGVGSPVKINVIPSTSEATLDCRLLPGVNKDEFISDMKARINDPRISITLESTPENAGVSRSDTPLFAAIGAAIRKHHPDAIVTPMLVPHGTDSVKLRSRGVIAYGLTPMVLDLAMAGSMHSDVERIPVAEFLKGLHIFYDLLSSDY
jgi:acetylornithine deacetylase/succinyl-diaminopimelate desuccinylase-like protein